MWPFNRRPAAHYKIYNSDGKFVAAVVRDIDAVRISKLLGRGTEVRWRHDENWILWIDGWQDGWADWTADKAVACMHLVLAEKRIAAAL